MRFRDKFIEKLKYSNFLRLVFDGIAKFGLRITPYYVVREGIWGTGMPSLEQPLKGYTLRFLVENDTDALGQLRNGQYPEGQLAQRLNKGHLCLGLVHAGRIVAFNWANPHEFSGNLCRFDLEPDEAYLYDAYTIPDYRGKRLAPYLRYQTYRCLSRRGMNRIYSISDAFNTPSIRFKQKLKARFVKLGLSIQLLNRRTYNITLRQLPDFKNRLQASVQEE